VNAAQREGTGARGEPRWQGPTFGEGISASASTLSLRGVESP